MAAAQSAHGRARRSLAAGVFTAQPAAGTHAELKAVDKWVADRTEAELQYGHISGWDVSRVGDLTNLFGGQFAFNDDIGGWDTSSVSSLEGTFWFATSFDRYIGGWDTSKVAKLRNAFSGAAAYNQQLGNWDTSKVTDM